MKNTILLLVLMGGLAYTDTTPLAIAPERPHFIAFRPIGTSVFALGQAHLHFTLNLTIATNQTRALCETIKETFDFLDKNSPGAHGSLLLQASTCYDTLAKLEGYNKLGTSITELPARLKRFLAVLLGVASAFLGMYNTAQIAGLQATQDNQGRMIDTIIHHMDGIDQRLSSQAKHINELNHLVSNLENRFLWLTASERNNADINSYMNAMMTHNQEIAEAIQALMLHRLSPNFAHPKEIQNALRITNKKAEALGYRLLITTVADIFQCETSFITRNGAIEVFVHIPMAYRYDELTLHEYIPIPFRISPSTDLSIRPDKRVLGISTNGRRFKAMHLEDLSRCTHMGQTYLCQEESVYRRPDDNVDRNKDTTKRINDEECLYYLFQQDYPGINRTCPVHLLRPTNSARVISPNRYITTNLVPHRGTITCRNGSISYFTADTVSIINLEPGCIAETSTHVLTATLDIPVEVKTVAYAWYEDPATLIHTLELEVYEGLRQQHKLDDVPTEASDAAAWTQGKLEYESHKNTSNGTMIALIIVATIIIIGAGIGIFLFIRYRTQIATAMLTMQSTLQTHTAAPPYYPNPTFTMTGRKRLPSDPYDDGFAIQETDARINIPRT
jgi:Baculovirus F protein